MTLAFHPYADLFPLIEGERFAELVADVKANDLHERIDVWDGAILDGRNRYRAALAAGILDADDGPDRSKYFRRYLPTVDGDPLQYVLSKNLHRRHLTDNQRASLGGKIANLGRGRPGEENPPIGGISAEQAALAVNTSVRQIERARVVHAQGIGDLRAALDRGDIAVSAAEKIARMPEMEQQREVERVLPHGSRAIMGSRHEPDDSLDYFPTPPWATRALMEVVMPRLGVSRFDTAWEPACGEGHIADPLREYFGRVEATDIHAYGYSDMPPLDFLIDGSVVLPDAEWIITNPPFGDKALQFALKAIDRATVGAAMFVRQQWLEGGGRYNELFKPFPPTMIAQFAERVPLCKGRWDPAGNTATAYCWVIWIPDRVPRAPTEFFWIPPGACNAFTRDDDATRFTTQPVTKRVIPVDAAGEQVDHDPSTGEVVEQPQPSLPG